MLQLYRSSEIALDTLIWKNGMPDWEKLSAVPDELSYFLDPKNSAVPPLGGKGAGGRTIPSPSSYSRQHEGPESGRPSSQFNQAGPEAGRPQSQSHPGRAPPSQYQQQAPSRSQPSSHTTQYPTNYPSPSSTPRQNQRPVPRIEPAPSAAASPPAAKNTREHFIALWEKIYQMAKPDTTTNLIHGDHLRPLLLTSKLDMAHLSHIWKTSTAGDGRQPMTEAAKVGWVTKEQLYFILMLIAIAQQSADPTSICWETLERARKDPDFHQRIPLPAIGALDDAEPVRPAQRVAPRGGYDGGRAGGPPNAGGPAPPAGGAGRGGYGAPHGSPGGPESRKRFGFGQQGGQGPAKQSRFS